MHIKLHLESWKEAPNPRYAARVCECVWVSGVHLFIIIFLVGWIIIKTLEAIDDDTMFASHATRARRWPSFVHFYWFCQANEAVVCVVHTRVERLGCWLAGHKIPVRICILHYYLPNDDVDARSHEAEQPFGGIISSGWSHTATRHQCQPEYTVIHCT